MSAQAVLTNPLRSRSPKGCSKMRLSHFDCDSGEYPEGIVNLNDDTLQATAGGFIDQNEMTCGRILLCHVARTAVGAKNRPFRAVDLTT